ncbi:hypothetical protein ACTXL8_15110 [Glutamicibacter arilaitensis]
MAAHCQADRADNGAGLAGCNRFDAFNHVRPRGEAAHAGMVQEIEVFRTFADEGLDSNAARPFLVNR